MGESEKGSVRERHLNTGQIHSAHYNYKDCITESEIGAVKTGSLSKKENLKAIVDRLQAFSSPRNFCGKQREKTENVT